MAKKTGLGKGMAALFPAVEEEGSKYFACPIEDIRPNDDQPRKKFSSEKMQELVASIREKGIIQPLVVRRVDGCYELIAGERRWRAAQKAGLREVPVVIQDVNDDAALEMALIENIQREDLNVIEQAEAFRSLMERFDLSQEEMAKRVGKDRSTVANSLRLLNLPSSIKADILDERISMGHARALLSLEAVELMECACQEIVHKHLTVRASEKLVKRLKTKRTIQKKITSAQQQDAISEQLVKMLMAKVVIRRTGSRGRIEISFSSEDDLARIIDILLDHK